MAGKKRVAYFYDCAYSLTTPFELSPRFCEECAAQVASRASGVSAVEYEEWCSADPVMREPFGASLVLVLKKALCLRRS